MKRVEITYMSNIKELQKLTERLEKAEQRYAKKLEAAKKAGVAEWSNEERRQWLATCEKTPDGVWLVNKEDCKRNGAWMDMVGAADDVEELKDRIERAERRTQKAEAAYTEHVKEVEAIEDLKRKEELQRLEFEAEQREWAKDGITLEARYRGKTPKGKGFSIVGNNGWTNRSRHCFTLYLEGQGVVFTSGEFWRAYGVIKKS